MTQEPTEAQIQKILDKAGNNPRKLAIAYFKAQARARKGSEAKIYGHINDIYSTLAEAVTEKGHKT